MYAQTPTLPAGYEDWQVVHLEWDLPSHILAVGLTAANPSQGRTLGVVQLYYRNNYYWYLKQQWEGDRLAFLGFDNESVNRLFMSQLIANPDKVAIPAVRIVEIGWDLNSCINVTSTVNITPTASGAKGAPRKNARESQSVSPSAGVAALVSASSAPREEVDTRKLTEEERLKRW